METEAQQTDNDVSDEQTFGAYPKDAGIKLAASERS